jgi:hypothetical protein
MVYCIYDQLEGIKMPKGFPKSGFRKTRTGEKIFVTGEPKSRKTKVPRIETAGEYPLPEPMAKMMPVETEEQIASRISERFEILESMTAGCISSHTRSLIVSGPPGLGKSFSVDKTLSEFDPNRIDWKFVKGYVRATGLYKLLYQYRRPGQTIVFDDADTIFFDETSLNMLKAVCDTDKRREVSWRSEAKFIDEESAEIIPNSFEFHGAIIFITNYDFDAMIAKGHRLAPHLAAMISRSHYINLSLRTRQDYLVRIKQVVALGMLDDQGLTPQEGKDVVDFIENNINTIRELSLRMAVKLASIRRGNPSKWMKIARVTCLKGF